MTTGEKTAADWKAAAEKAQREADRAGAALWKVEAILDSLAEGGTVLGVVAALHALFDTAYAEGEGNQQWWDRAADQVESGWRERALSAEALLRSQESR